MKSPSDQNESPTNPPAGMMPTTHWSVVLTAADTAAPAAVDALEKLCRAYWPPVYAFVRRQGRNHEDALDLTQEFFARFLEKKKFKLADPDRGRFRSFLITSLKNFLIDVTRDEHSHKHGGGFRVVSREAQQEAE